MSDADKFDIDSGEDFDSDDSEINRELEERIRLAAEAGNEKIFDDVSDAQSVYSAMGNTMSQMNFIPIDTDLDNLIDQMLINSNPNHMAELEKQRNERLDFVRQEQIEDEAMLFTEENKRNVQDIKQLNQINLAELIPAKAPVVAAIDAKGDQEKAPEEETKTVPKIKEESKLQIITTSVAASEAQQ